MAKADTSVKYFHSAMPGAPVLSGIAGALIAVLDACLLDGFGLKAVDTLVVSGNVATVSINSGHSAEKDTVVLIAGATPAELNGEWKVASTSATTLTFVTAGIADQAASGAITLKMAPAGWGKEFSGANLAAYRSNNAESTRNHLRVDDNGTNNARVVGYETMTDVSSGEGRFPLEIQRTGGLWWPKSATANATARTWLVICDDRTFFYMPCADGYSYPQYFYMYTFGDFLSTKSGDPYACMLFGTQNDVASSNTSADNHLFGSIGYQAELYVPRSYTGMGASQQLARNFLSGNSLQASGSPGHAWGFPNASDGGLYLANMFLVEMGLKTLRGTVPGYFPVPQAIPLGSFSTRDKLVGVSGLPGKTLMVQTAYCPWFTSTSFFDITGPWR